MVLCTEGGLIQRLQKPLHKMLKIIVKCAKKVLNSLQNVLLTIVFAQKGGYLIKNDSKSAKNIILIKFSLRERIIKNKCYFGFSSLRPWSYLNSIFHAAIFAIFRK